MKIKFNLMLFILFIALIPNVISHLDAGEDKEVDDYIIDFGYSPENPTTKDKVAIALTLFDKNEEVIEPESVWIRISNSEKVIFAGTFKPNENIAFTYNFPEEDTYEITARFNNDKETIVETDFSLEIKEIVPLSSYYILAGIIILIIFIVTKFGIKRS
jgi:hypothetical protein